MAFLKKTSIGANTSSFYKNQTLVNVLSNGVILSSRHSKLKHTLSTNLTTTVDWSFVFITLILSFFLYLVYFVVSYICCTNYLIGTTLANYSRKRTWQKKVAKKTWVNRTMTKISSNINVYTGKQCIKYWTDNKTDRIVLFYWETSKEN